ncbi:MAG TPA: PAS domain S-box protein [Gemmataceae bacterium]
MDNLTGPQAPAGVPIPLPEQFREWADFFPEALLLLSREGFVQAANAGAASLLGRANAELVGCDLSRLAASSSVPLDQLLHACFVNEGRVSAFLNVSGKQGQAIACRAEGGVVRFGGANTEAHVLLRLGPDQGFPAGLSALNRRVDELTQEVARRRQVEEALRESEARYRTQVEHAPEAIVVLDMTTGRFVDANENAACLFGTSKVALLQVGPVDLSPPVQPDGTSSHDAAQRYFGEALAGGVPVFEWTYRNAAEEDIPCEIRLVRLPTAGRSLVRGSITDIRARKWAEWRVLRLNRLYYILSEINEAILRVRDPEQLYERVCRIAVQGGLLRMAWVGLVDAATQLVRPAAHWGIEEGYLEGLQITAADVPRGRGPVGTAIRERRYDICNDLTTDPRMEPWRAEGVQRGYRSVAAFPLIVQDRTIGALTLYSAEIDFFKADEIHLMESLANNLAFAIATLEQDKQRLRAEQEREMLVSLIENSSDFICLASLNRKIIFLNAAGRRLVGVQQGADVRALALPDFVTENAWAETREIFERVLASTGHWEGESQFRQFETREAIAIHMHAFLVKHPQTGAPMCLAAVARDIREQKRLEEQFRQAQKMEAVGRLAGGVAHDFNNLLTVITGYTELLLGEQSANDSSRELLEQIRKASERAATLTGRLLAFSRKQVLQPEILDLNTVVRDVERMLRRLIGEDIHLRTILDPALGSVRADRGQIEQSLINLVVNARDAMPQGGNLTVETRNVLVDETTARPGAGLQPGSFVLVIVKDTGSGMSRETLAHLFEPFFTTKEIGRGTGLGLAMTYGIVRQSGGHIEVSSQPGEGSTFQIFLPCVETPKAVGSLENSDDPMRPGTETILLVEDEAGVRNLAALVLRGNGYKVLEAGDGAEALQIVATEVEPIDLLLTDVVMPGMSGRQLADRVKDLRPDTRVLFQSGYTDDAIVHYGVCGAETAFLQKPYSGSALTRKVREVLEQERQVVW